MTFTVVSTAVTAPATFATSNSTLLVMANASVIVTDGGTLAAGAANLGVSNLNVMVDGLVAAFRTDVGATTAMQFGSSGGAAGLGSNDVSIGTTGVIRATGIGISLLGSANSVTNLGLIDTGAFGIKGSGDFAKVVNGGTLVSQTGIDLTGFNQTVINTGNVTADILGVRLEGISSDFQNTGTVQSQSVGVAINGIDGSLLNSGTIMGRGRGIEFSGLTGRIENSGTVQAVFLGAVITASSTSFTNSGDVLGGTVGIAITGDQNLVTNSGRINALGDQGNAIDATGFALQIANSGALSGARAGINYSGDATNSGTVTITNSATGQIKGQISGITLIYADDAVGGEFARIENSGTITGGTSGVLIDGLPVTLLNSGTIQATGGPAILSDSEQDARVVNTGLIASLLPVNAGVAVAIDLRGTFGGGASDLRNFGTILGNVQMSDQTSTIRNRGLIDGDVRLDLGDDSFNGRGGFVTGAVFGDGGNDQLTGGADDDRLNGGSGNDSLAGGAGDDVLRGSTGVDVLTGGVGRDVFVFANKAEVFAAGLADHISDFQTGQDVIDFGFLANGAFIGAAAFSNVAGQVRYTAATGVVACDTDGNGSANFSLILDNRSVLVAADFLL